MKEDENADTLPPGAPESDPVENLFDLLDVFSDTVEAAKQPRTDGRPKELFVRWRVVDGGIEITSCTELDMGAPPEGEFQSRFR